MSSRKALFLCQLHFSLILTSGPLNFSGQTTNILPFSINEMKSLSSIFSCCFGWSQGCVFQKSFISVSITLFTYFDKWTIKFQWTNNQHITLLYNEMKSLSSIFSCCFGPKGVSSRNALFLCQLHFSLNIRSQEMKSLSSIFSCCFGPKGVSSRKAIFLC